MVSKQDLRSEETKNKILKAAGKLFGKRGYDVVTIREIAKEAGCSHTAIYLYYKDKESLLHHLAMPLLHELKELLEKIDQQTNLNGPAKLKAICLTFIEFCLLHQSMYITFISANASRVDEQDPKLQINKVRIELFQLLKDVLNNALTLSENAQSLAFSRILFYNLHGMVSTYLNHKEPLQKLLDRLSSTFEQSIDALYLGFQEIIKQGANNES
ncbi:TetR/AcrR family transcriptional regulator [Fictibacillus terranigra]|uniref:TetR/AcrR family transcriptional regulator n=1 Tax=Fictibacillus terranigra TaxID=3058424 RepID=A0ABT8E394_9BACL|nr:TetR/AcrR family transcriptional regulator [Fictibacillus sp. CENA-BCM004]MDN4072382.1 TetR/AcrR family transcriptional regulator [Fictibacillus sp. CENA-BCM004]